MWDWIECEADGLMELSRNNASNGQVFGGQDFHSLDGGLGVTFSKRVLKAKPTRLSTSEDVGGGCTRWQVTNSLHESTSLLRYYLMELWVGEPAWKAYVIHGWMKVLIVSNFCLGARSDFFILSSFAIWKQVWLQAPTAM